MMGNNPDYTASNAFYVSSKMMRPWRYQSCVTVMAGAASALFGAIEFIMAFVISTVIMLNKVTNTLPLGYVTLTLGITSLVLCITGKKQVTLHNSSK